MDSRVFRLALGVTLLPLAVSAVTLVFGVGGDYLPAGDLAMTEMHVRDVGRGEVLVGLWSRWDWNHPGPVLFYVLAPFYWLTGSASIGLHLGALAINGAAVAGIGLLARRRGGISLALCTLAGCLLVMRTLSGDFFHDPWNLYITFFPYALFLFLVWSMICGDEWALPLGVVVASFLVQTHVGFLVLAAPLLAWGIAALGWSTLRERAADGGDSATSDSNSDHNRGGELIRRLLRPGLTTAGVGALLWLPPLIDAFVHSPSNLYRTYRYFTRSPDPTNSVTDGWRVISGQFALAPEWLTTKQAANALTGEPKVIDAPELPLLLPVVVAAAVALWSGLGRIRAGNGDDRGRDRGLVVVLGLAFATGTAAVVRTIGPAFDYRLRWTWVLPTVAAITVAWTAWRTVAARWQAAQRWLVSGFVVAVMILGALNVVSAGRSGVPHEPDSDVIAALSEPTLDLVDADSGQVIVSEHALMALGPWYSRSLVLQLERHGIDARVSKDLGVYFNRDRVEGSGPVQARLVIATEDQIESARDQPGYRLVAQWTAVPEPERARITSELRELEEARAAGRLDEAERWARFVELNDQLKGDEDTAGASATAVAVFSVSGN